LEENNSKIKNGSLSWKSWGNIVVALKLLMPSLWICDEFLWNRGVGTNTWIDIVLPKGTPIPSFSNGKVVRVKKWDWVSQDEWNCVVIQSGNLFWSYQYLDEIELEYWQKILKSSIVGTCGKSGKTTQPCVKVQIDTESAVFHPYWSNQILNIQKNTEDPIFHLKKLVNIKFPFWDMPEEKKFQQSILGLFKLGLLDSVDKKVFPDKPLSRWESAVFFYKLAKRKDLFRRLPIVNHDFVSYVDMQNLDEEMLLILKDLQKYGILVGFQNKFFPHENLKAKHLLVLLGRLFFHIQDAEGENWYQTYLNYFRVHWFISEEWDFVGKELFRKEVYLLVWKVVCSL